MDYQLVVNRIAGLHIQTRLRDLERVILVSETDRTARLTAVLGSLHSGAYLVGVGPYTSRVIPLGSCEVTLGRHATPLEEPDDRVIDYEVSDQLFLGPAEVSRCHCTVGCTIVGEETEVWVQDQSSTVGTFINGNRIADHPNKSRLNHSDILTLGSSGIACYVMVLIED